MEKEWREEEHHMVRHGQHKFDITISCLNFQLYLREIDEERDPYEASKQFATDLMKAIGPRLSIVNLRHLMQALAQQYEQHWQWRNDWEKKQGEAHKNIELTETKHTPKVGNE